MGLCHDAYCPCMSVPALSPQNILGFSFFIFLSQTSPKKLVEVPPVCKANFMKSFRSTQKRNGRIQEGSQKRFL